MSFSDMLGNHNLFAQVNADTYGGGFGDLLDNTGGLLAYTNLSRRMNWGVAVEQSPYIAGGYAVRQGIVNGEAALIDSTIIRRQVNRGVSGMLAYPFSQTVRLEFGGGFTRTSFDQQVQTIATSLRTGRLLADTTETTELADTLNLSSANAALVTDSSLFGATSPVAGSRSRFEITPTFGDLRLTNALADYRHYFMPARFYTIAVRGMHYGRYGTDGEDPRLVPLFLGYPEFVRGYGSNSFEPDECVSSVSCPTFDRLVGSHVWPDSGRGRVLSRRWRHLEPQRATVRGIAGAGDERRHLLPQQPAGVCDRADRLRPSVRQAGERVGVGIFADAGVLRGRRGS
jgi:hypothetical protein